MNYQIKESLKFNSVENCELQDTIEILQEQLESLNQLLLYKELEIQEMEQELLSTNQELCSALSLECLTLEEAKELAKKILASQKPTGECLAELLSAIYGSSVKADELEPIDTSFAKPLKIDLSDAIINEYKANIAQCAALREKNSKIQAQCKILRYRSGEIRARYKEFKGILNKL